MSDDVWIPAGFADKFKVGATVRIRMSKECPEQMKAHGRDDLIDSKTGVIVGMRRDPSTHPYIVDLGGRIGRYRNVSYFAAIEMEAV